MTPFIVAYDVDTHRVNRVWQFLDITESKPGLMFIDEDGLEASGLGSFLDDDNQLTVAPETLGCDGETVYELLETLPEAKARLIPIVDAETARRLAAGFQINGKTFSLSLQAQSTLRSMWEERTSLSYPVLFPTSDDSEMVSIANQAALENGIQTARQAVNDRTQAGREAKQGILAAADVAAAQSIYDAYVIG